VARVWQQPRLRRSLPSLILCFLTRPFSLPPHSIALAPPCFLPYWPVLTRFHLFFFVSLFLCPPPFFYPIVICRYGFLPFSFSRFFYLFPPGLLGWSPGFQASLIPIFLFSLDACPCPPHDFLVPACFCRFPSFSPPIPLAQRQPPPAIFLCFGRRICSFLVSLLGLWRRPPSLKQGTVAQVDGSPSFFHLFFA